MSYNLLLPVHAVTNGSMASSIISTVVEIKNQDNIGVQIQWTGVPVGTFSVQVSMNFFEDINGNIVNPGTWISLPLSPAIAAAGSADSAYVDLNQLSAPYVRVVYTRTSGTGTLNVMINGKGV